MAIIKEGILLASVKSNSITGISVGSSSVNLVLTEGCRISVYNISDQKLICNWLAKTDQKLTCSAVELEADVKFSAVINSQILRSWSRDAVIIDKEYKMKLTRPSHQLFAMSGRLFVLYQDGSLGTADQLLYEAPCTTSSPFIIWTQMHQVGSSACVVVVFRDKSRSKLEQYLVRSYLLTSAFSSVDVSETLLQPPSNRVYPVAFCLQSIASDIYLISQYVDGGLQRTPLVTNSPSASVSQGLMSPPVSTHCKHSMAVAAIDAVQVAVIGPASAAESAVGIGIWDTKFGIYHSWIPLSDGKQLHGQMFYANGRLLVACTNGIYVFPVVPKVATLSACLGKTSKQALVQGSLKAIPKDLDSAFQRLADPCQTESYALFKKSFQVVHEWLKVRSETLQRCHSSDDLLSVLPLVSAVVLRCIGEKQFWPITELSELITARLIRTSVCRELCQALAAHQEIETLLRCLAFIHDIPESAMLTCLKCFLVADESNFSNVSIPTTSDDSCIDVFSPQRAHCINLVLVLPYNDVFLLEALHQLKYRQVVELLRYLEQLLCTLSAVSSTDSNYPSVTQVIDWISLLIDAHYAQMALSSDTPDLHIRLQRALHVQQEDISVMNEIAERLLSILRGRKTQEPDVGSYCITMLHID